MSKKCIVNYIAISILNQNSFNDPNAYRECVGMSGRSIRKLPVLAYSKSKLVTHNF